MLVAVSINQNIGGDCLLFPSVARKQAPKLLHLLNGRLLPGTEAFHCKSQDNNSFKKVGVDQYWRIIPELTKRILSQDDPSMN